jgi:hypothetical protein
MSHLSASSGTARIAGAHLGKSRELMGVEDLFKFGAR